MQHADAKVSRNIFTLVLSRIVAAALVLVAYAVVFRYLGPYKAGQYQFILSFVMLFSVVVDFGIQQLVIKKVSENKEEAQKYLGNFFAVEVLLAIFIFGLLALVAYVDHYDPAVFHGIILAGFGMVINALTIPYTAIISAYEDMHILAAVNFLDSVFNVLVIFAAVILQQGVFFLSSVQLVNAIMHIVVYQSLIRKYVQRPQLWHYVRNLDWQLVKKMFTLALPFGALVGFSVVYNKIDVIIVTAVRGYAENGLYAAAYKFFDLVRFFPAVVSSALYPFYSNQIIAGNMPAVRHSLEKYTKYMFVLGAPVFFGGTVLAVRLITLVGGNQFLAASGAMLWLTLASAFVFIYAPVNSIIINQLTRRAVQITFANILINTVGNLILVPLYGFKAAAFMTAVSEAAQMCLYFYFVRKQITVFPVAKYIFKPVFAGLIMAAVLYPLRLHSLLLTLPLGVGVYAAAVFILGVFNKDDLAAARSLAAGKLNI